MSPTYMPLPNVQVRLFDAGLSAPIDQGITDENGEFHLQAFHYGANSIYYVTASVSDEVVLMAVIGQALFVDNIVVNELTTVAAVWSLAQFFNEQQVIEGPRFGLRIAALMNTNIVQVHTGDSSNVLTSPPNGNQTNAWRLTLSLANLLVTGVRDPHTALLALFNLATPPGGTRPTNTIAAMLNIARNPASQVQAIYDQAHAAGVYDPPLENVPEAWTLAVKVNDSGNNDMMFGGPGNIAFDRYGRAWIPNNVVQGQPYSCTWAMLLDPAGRPAIDGDKQKLSPITGGGIIGGGFGVAIDGNDHVWLGNFGWGESQYYPAECVSELNLDTTAVSPAGTGGADRVQGTVVDPLSGNVWFAGFQSHTVFVYIGGSPDNFARYDPSDDTFDPFGIAIAADGTAWVTSTNSQNPQIVHLQLDSVNKVITAIGEPIYVGAQNKGVMVDSGGNVWFAAASDDPKKDCIYFFGSDGTRKTFQGGGMHGPWGITLDGDDNLWVGNFGSMLPENVFEGRVTQRFRDLAESDMESRPGADSVQRLHAADGRRSGDARERRPALRQGRRAESHPDDAHDRPAGRRGRQCLDLQQLEAELHGRLQGRQLRRRRHRDLRRRRHAAGPEGSMTMRHSKSLLLLVLVALPLSMPAQPAPQPAPPAPRPEQPEFIRRAQELARGGRLDEALAVYQAEVKTSPNSVAANNGAGVVLDLLGRTKEAKTYFHRAIELAETPAAKTNARRALAMSYAFDNDCANTTKYEEMAADYWASVPDFFRQGEAYNEAARVCIEAGAFDDAEKLYLRGQEAGLKEPDISPARVALWKFRTEHALARLAARRNQPDVAKKHVAAARALLDADPEMAKDQEIFFPYLTGYVALYGGDAKTALAELRKARQDDPFIQVLMAQAYEKLGDREQADALYRKAASTTAHNPPAAFAQPLAMKKTKR